MLISPADKCDTLQRLRVASVESPWLDTTVFFQKYMYVQDVLFNKKERTTELNC